MATITYKQAGVDVRANTRWVSAIEAAMQSTYGPRVLKQPHGGFAGLFRLDKDGKKKKVTIKTTKIAQLDKPTALAFAEDGTLYVTVIETKDGKNEGKLLKIAADQLK